MFHCNVLIDLVGWSMEWGSVKCTDIENMLKKVYMLQVKIIFRSFLF